MGKGRQAVPIMSARGIDGHASLRSLRLPAHPTALDGGGGGGWV